MKNINKSINLYRLIVLLFFLSSFPGLTILLGLKIFCNESFYSVYLGAYTVANSTIIYIEIAFLFILCLFTHIVNKVLKEITLPFDSVMEENKTVIKNYSKYSVEYYYLIPTALSILLCFLSHIEVFPECSTGLLFIIILAIGQFAFGFVNFYNYIQYIIFLEDNKLKTSKKNRAS